MISPSNLVCNFFVSCSHISKLFTYKIYKMLLAKSWNATTIPQFSDLILPSSKCLILSSQVTTSCFISYSQGFQNLNYCQKFWNNPTFLKAEVISRPLKFLKRQNYWVYSQLSQFFFKICIIKNRLINLHIK